jgi:hypothetical protein
MKISQAWAERRQKASSLKDLKCLDPLRVPRRLEHPCILESPESSPKHHEWVAVPQSSIAEI